jgi:hypothetical protein
LLEDAGVQDALLAAVRDRYTPGYASLLRLLAAYAAGPPPREAARDDPIDRLARRISGMSEDELESLQRAPERQILRLIEQADPDFDQQRASGRRQRSRAS